MPRASRYGLAALVSTLRLALGAMWSHKLRTALTLSGIVLGITGLVTMMAALNVLSTSVSDVFLEHGAGVFRIQRRIHWSDEGDIKALGDRPLEHQHLLALQERLARVDRVAGEMWAWEQRMSHGPAEADRLTVVGGTSALLESNTLALELGRSISEVDVRSARPVVVLGAEVARTLFPAGPRAALEREVILAGQPFHVVGVLRAAPPTTNEDRNRFVLMPLTTFERVMGTRSLYLTLRAHPPEELAAAVAESRAVLRRVRGLAPETPDDFTVTSNLDLEKPLRNLSLIIGASAGTLSLLALFIGGIGVMNIMLASVTQRTREIGLRMALGARPGVVRLQFITEAALQTFLGGALGVGLAWLILQVAGLALEVDMPLPGWAVLLGLASSTLTGVLAGSYPAARAAAMEPIQALRHE